MHFKTLRRKPNLHVASALGMQKENWGNCMHFSEIIKLPLEKNMPYITLYFTAF